MSNWLLVVCQDWLGYIVHQLKKELLKQDYLHIDETHVQVLQESGRKNTSDSYMWVYCSTKDAEAPIRYFEYQPGRGYLQAAQKKPPQVPGSIKRMGLP